MAGSDIGEFWPEYGLEAVWTIPARPAKSAP
jgi:hypothetical protein